MSYATKERKATRNWFIGASIIVAIIFLLFVTNNNTYFHHYYENAGGFWKALGWLTTGAWYLFAWWVFPSYRNQYQWIERHAGKIVFGGLLLIILFLAGFNFSLL